MIESVHAEAFTIPTESPEADGTLEWTSTTLVVVHVIGSGETGLGYTYSHASIADLINRTLAGEIAGLDAMAVPSIWAAMVRAVRNLGHAGLAASAIAAVDSALWDLKARLLDLPLADLLGRARDAVPIYGSGGFTTYPPERLAEQLSEWAAHGIGMVKMKVGAAQGEDLGRVRHVRRAIGPEVKLLVDANGAYDRKQALDLAYAFADEDVTWFEEPVSSDDLEGLSLLRDRAPAGMDIAAGEYGYDPFYFRRMLESGAVDVLQIDATRCAGVTGFLRVAALADAFGIAVSSHTAPMLHLPLCCCVPRLRHMEWFHDHVRIERMLFDGVQHPRHGALAPAADRPGFGIELRRQDAAAFAA